MLQTPKAQNIVIRILNSFRFVLSTGSVVIAQAFLLQECCKSNFLRASLYVLQSFYGCPTIVQQVSLLLKYLVYREKIK